MCQHHSIANHTFIPSFAYQPSVPNIPRTPPPTDTFDFLLTRDLSRGHIVDFNPYLPRTDPLLFTYEELHAILLAREGLELRVVDSPAHPAAARNAPAHQHNMVPIEALTMSSGRDVGEFADVLQEEIRKSMAGEDGDDASAPSPS